MLRLITKKSSKIQYERQISHDEREVVFDKFGRLRNFSFKEKDIVLGLVSEMKKATSCLSDTVIPTCIIW